MKILKTVLISPMIFVSGCSTSSPNYLDASLLKPNQISTEELALYDKKNSTMIKLGMSRAEVEKQIGEPNEFNNVVYTYQYDGIEIRYDNKNHDRVIAICINDNTPNYTKYATPRDIRYNDLYSDVISTYGDKGLVTESDSNISLTYALELKDNKFTMIKDYFGLDTNNIYYVSMNFYNKDKLSYLLISDYEFAQNPTKYY
ncbi:hypothetical protein [Paenibacillus terrigena]|uniref:hypothetical protein n=1 Tax=Paenibacillus terrigena TaxID=369333 RepID=UPI00036970E7|nr:hypothetical protein [Paenibacillus terrigena]